MANNIVAEWLHSLHLGQYAESFIDNGYDDLEICKQVGDPDLDAIGVFNPVHRSRLLHSVRTLREEGAASVYFTLEESTAIHEEKCFCDNVSAKSSRTSSGRSDKEVAAITYSRVSASPEASSSAESGHEVAKYLDEYEEGKAELVKIPRMQLQMLLREKLSQDGIRLNCQPYSTPDVEWGYLEGLASRYADLYNTHYVDVLGHLEDLRKRERIEASSKELVIITPGTPPTCQTLQSSVPVTTGHGLTSSQSQPIYVPGKYSPSSCLSDKEEDEIYGFGYGVFAAQVAIQQQQMLMGHIPTSHQPLLIHQQHNYQTCLSPRSAYFYEFPPNEQNYTNTSKKRTTFARFLRGLKTSHRKEKHGASSPRHGRAATTDIPQRVDTPDSVLQSGIALTDLGQHAVIRSMVDPRDYDRLRYLQMNGGTPNTFEETIYKLKLQEALRKREKISKEHEEILRDIKQGLLQLQKDEAGGTLSNEDTYMYDEDVCMLTPDSSNNDRGHWYDEPPYESDPEDFLMSNSSPGATNTIQNGRVCFSVNLRQESQMEGVFSVRSAGNISLPKDTVSSAKPRVTPRRTPMLPQISYPPTVIPFRSSYGKESGDYGGSVIQSVGSRLSSLSIDMSRQQEIRELISPQYYTQLEENMKHFKETIGCPRNEGGASPIQSSVYEDREDIRKCSQQITTFHLLNDGISNVCGIVGKVREFRHDVQRKLSRLKNDTSEKQKTLKQAYRYFASSVESLPTGSESSTQALVRSSSNHSFISTEELGPNSAGHILDKARALIDHDVQTLYDQEVLKFKAGDISNSNSSKQILSTDPSGLWKGICHGKKGTFKFINVELLSQNEVKTKQDIIWQSNNKIKPTSVEELLQKISLQQYISVFNLNGYEDLELFREIEPSDLDYLGIINTDHRAKILSAVQFLYDLDFSSEGGMTSSSSECDEHQQHVRKSDGSSFTRGQFPRDSGCYDAPMKAFQQCISPQEESDTSVDSSFRENKNNLDSIVERCNNAILAKVRNSQNSIITKELSYKPNIPSNLVPISPNSEVINKPEGSYVSFQGQTTLIDSGRKNVVDRVNSRKCFEQLCEEDQKLISVKYVVGEDSDLGLSESGTVNVLGKSCFSEKSSDSGVSNSSLSSGNTKDTRPVLSHHFMVCLDYGNINLSDCTNTSDFVNK